jgi:hypothetical protein
VKALGDDGANGDDGDSDIENSSQFNQWIIKWENRRD